LGLFKDEIDFIAGLPPIKADPLVNEKLIETKSLINNEDYFILILIVGDIKPHLFLLPLLNGLFQ
jgi:hypothetical protein